MKEGNYPLIPRSTLVENHGTESVICDAFQEILEGSKYPENIAKNLTKYNSECEFSKYGAICVQQSMHKALLQMEDIAIVEEKLMYKHGKYLIKEYNIKDKTFEKEKRLLTRESLFQSMSKTDLNKYGLLEGNDLVPSKLKRVLDFKVNENQHECRSCCDSAIDLDVTPVKLQDKEKDKHTKKATLYTYLPTILSKPTPRGTKNIFKLLTDQIVFYNYKINRTYKKILKLQNISKTPQTIRVDSQPSSGLFKIKLQMSGDRQIKVPSGMIVTFSVYFRSSSYMDTQDEFVVNSLKVKLASFREAPNLCVYIFKSFSTASKSFHHLDVSRSIALNNCIDCGACFLSQVVNVYMIMKNNGGAGTFFFIPEEEWFTSQVNSVYHNLELEIGSYKIFPCYFEINTNEYIIIRLQYMARDFGMNLERIMLLCNNITYESLDIIADTIIFDEHTVQFDEKNLLHPANAVEILRTGIAEALGRDDASAIEAHNSVEVLYKSTRASKEHLYQGGEEDILDERHVGFDLLDPYDEYEMHYNTPVPASPTETILDYLKYIDHETPSYEYQEKYCKKYWIYFEKCVPFQTNSHTITFTNNCPIDLRYRWEVCFESPLDLESANLYKLDRNCVTITPQNEWLPRYDTVTATIAITPNTIQCGFYAIKVRFVILCIPKLAIYNESLYITYPHSDCEHNYKCNLVDVQQAEFSLLCQISEFMIVVDPEHLVVQNVLKYGETFKSQFTVYVGCDDSQDLEAKWIIDNPKVIAIIPTSVQFKGFQTITFTAIVKNYGYDNIHESVVLEVNKIYKKVITIVAPVATPHLTFNVEQIDFGYLHVGNTYSKRIKIINDNHVAIDWEVWETYKNDNELMTRNLVSMFVTNLPDANIEIEYVLQAEEPADIESLLHLYSFYRQKKTLDSVCLIKYKIENFTVCMYSEMTGCPILCPNELLFLDQTSTHRICLHNLTHKSAFYRFGDVYGDSSGLATIKMVPNEGYVEPDRINMLDVHITPHSTGTLDDIYIACYLESCNELTRSVQVVPQPLILAILCAVEDIYVKFILPLANSPNEKELLWPPPPLRDEVIDHEMAEMKDEEEAEQSETVDENERTDRTEEKTQSAEAREQYSHMTTNTTEPTKQTFDMSYYRYVSSYLDLVEQDPDDDSQPEPVSATFTVSEAKSRNYEDSEVPFGSDSSHFMSDTFLGLPPTFTYETLRSCFDQTVPINDNVLEFHRVPTRKAVKKTIKIMNLTPIVGKITAELSDFHPCEITRHQLDNILIQLKIKEDDEWERMVCKDGIVFKLDIDSDELKERETIKIDVWVYGNTWGLYANELSIEINNLMPFSITVIAEIIGAPIEFPIAINQQNKTPILRFTPNSITLPRTRMRPQNHLHIRHIMLYHFEKGVPLMVEIRWSTSSFFICKICVARYKPLGPSFNLAFANRSLAEKFVEIGNYSAAFQPFSKFGTISYQVGMETRKVYVRNTCNIPIIVYWHIFMKGKDHDNQPITYVFDLFERSKYNEPKSSRNIILSHDRCMNKSNTAVFKVQPNEICLPPNDTSVVTVNFNAREFQTQFNKTDVKAFLIGCLQIPEDYRPTSNNVQRLTGFSTEPIKMRLTATLELPQLKLEMVKGDLRYTLYGSMLIDHKTEPSMNKRLVFKNFSNTECSIQLAIEYPLRILKVETPLEIGVDCQRCSCAKLRPLECVEVEIALRMEMSLLVQFAKTFYMSAKIPSCVDEVCYKRNCIKIFRNLHIIQKGYSSQTIPLEIFIYYPVVEVTDSLDFGVVFIGNCKEMLITVKNYSVCPVTFHLESSSRDVALKQKNGALKASKRGVPELIHVSVTFIPSIYSMYEETITLTTNIPYQTLTTDVTGIGKHNERYFQHDRC